MPSANKYMCSWLAYHSFPNGLAPKVLRLCFSTDVPKYVIVIVVLGRKLLHAPSLSLLLSDFASRNCKNIKIIIRNCVFFALYPQLLGLSIKFFHLSMTNCFIFSHITLFFTQFYLFEGQNNGARKHIPDAITVVIAAFFENYLNIYNG